MKPTKFLLAPVALTCFALVPATGITEDALEDLEVTMEVFDDLARIDGEFEERRRAEEAEIASAVDAENAGGMDDEADEMEEDVGLDIVSVNNDADSFEGSFEDDGAFDEDDLDEEDEFESEEGEDIDVDAFDEEPVDDPV